LGTRFPGVPGPRPVESSTPVCMCVCGWCVYIYTSIHRERYIHAYIHIYTYATHLGTRFPGVPGPRPVESSAPVCMCVCGCVYIYTSIYRERYIHAYIHIYTYATHLGTRFPGVPGPRPAESSAAPRPAPKGSAGRKIPPGALRRLTQYRGGLRRR